MRVDSRDSERHVDCGRLSVEVATYRRRQPEKTVLYQVIQENLATFLEHASSRSGGRGLPTYVRQEFERYLDCGILANGFARVRCPDCGYDTVVGFSCKGRGFCPSCSGRRMADTAAHLVDRVFPRVPIRQWVLSVPRQVRWHLARDSTLLTGVLKLFIEDVFRYYKRQYAMLREGVEGWRKSRWRYRRRLPFTGEAEGGGVTAIQRYGSSLNLHVHFHSLLLDGVYARDPETGKLWFVRVPEPEPEDLRIVLSRVIRRVTKLLVKKGCFLDGTKEEGGAISAEPADPSVLDVIQADSIHEVVRLGNGARKARVVGRDAGASPARKEKPFCEEKDGYTIHAGVRVNEDDREGLEKVCRYVLRPAFAEDRLFRRPDGMIEYGFRKPRWDGGTSMVLEPLQLMEKLAALVPPPRSHYAESMIMCRSEGSFSRNRRSPQ